MVRRGRRMLLAGLVACFCLAALPLSEAGRECAVAGCAANASAESVAAAPAPERVASAAEVRDQVPLTEGRSSVADVRGMDGAPAAAPQPAPQQALLTPVGDPDADDAPIGVDQEHVRHYHHHAWWAHRHHHAWR